MLSILTTIKQNGMDLQNTPAPLTLRTLQKKDSKSQRIREFPMRLSSRNIRDYTWSPTTMSAQAWAEQDSFNRYATMDVGGLNTTQQTTGNEECSERKVVFYRDNQIGY